MQRILIFLITFGIFKIGCFPSSESLSVRKQKELHFPDVNQTLYLKRLERGLNYQVSVISTKKQKKFEPNYKSEYVFSVGETSFFYKVRGDTLLIKTYNTAKVPEVFDSEIVIQQIELNNQELAKFKETYKEEGFSYFGN
jgi:hypothetical protein